MLKSIPLLTIALTFCLFTTSWGALPQIHVENDSFDFGEIYRGEKVAHTFSFLNKGDAPLNIEKVRSSCGCTAAVPSNSVVASGESAELRATFDSGRFQGQISKTIYLYTNDPIRKVVQFYIRGTVKDEIVLSPKTLNIGSVDPNSQWDGEIIVSNTGKNVIEITDAVTTIREMKLDVASKEIAPGEKTLVRIVINVPQGSRNINGYITLKVSGAQTDTLRIPVSALTRHNRGD